MLNSHSLVWLVISLGSGHGQSISIHVVYSLIVKGLQCMLLTVIFKVHFRGSVCGYFWLRGIRLRSIVWLCMPYFHYNDLLYVSELYPYNYCILVYITTWDYVHRCGALNGPVGWIMDTTTGYLYFCDYKGLLLF